MTSNSIAKLKLVPIHPVLRYWIMEDETNDNKIFEVDDDYDFEFKYNFITTPWDDRTPKSKIGIVSLLVSILCGILACVTYNLVTHFRTPRVKHTDLSEIKCHYARVEEIPYVARIHSSSSQELLCLGAVVSPTSVIANGFCARSGPIRLRLGNPTDPRCKKGFSVDVMEPIPHEGTVSNQLVLLFSSENMADCVQIINIANEVYWNNTAHIVGRPVRGERSLSRQTVRLAHKDDLVESTKKPLYLRSTICVRDKTKCPARVGDLLVQGGRVLGLAATSTHITEQSSLPCFANLMKVHQEMKEHDSSIFR